jgi:hypothetical protein
MAITIAQKSSIRRHLGYPVAGLARTGQAGGTLASGSIGYRWLQAYGFLEYKMNNLNPDEEARLTGNAYGAIAFSGPQPTPADTVEVVISGGGLLSPQTLSITAGPQVPGQDGRITVVNLLAAAGGSNPALQTAQIVCLSPYGTGAYSQNSVPFPEISFSGPKAFTLTATGSGATYPQITANGILLPPFATVSDAIGATPVYGYLPLLDALEGGYLGSAQNMDTKEAGPWKARMNEQAQRMSLYQTYRAQMADFLGTMINPDRKANPKRSGAMQFL